MDLANINRMLDKLRACSAEDFREAPFSRHKINANASEKQRDWLTEQILCADWICYPIEFEQLDPPRGRHLCHSYPQGFSLYTVNIDGENLPVGYTGWLPLTRQVFETMHERPQDLTHRGQITAEMPHDSRYFYFFNASIVPEMRKTPQSKQLVWDHVSALAPLNAIAISAVTISEDGIRMVSRMGMKTNGNMTHDGDVEPVYTAYLATLRRHHFGDEDAA
jgi:hypothetical protein